MATVYRVTAVWSGFIGAPGYSKFSFTDLTDDTLRNAAGARVRALFDGTKVHRAAAWSVLVLPTIEEFDMATGALTGASVMTTAPTAVAGTASATAYAGGAGYCVTWTTGLIYNRRRVRGRTFFVPSYFCFDVDGTLAVGDMTTINTAATTFHGPTAPRPAVWARLWDPADPKTQIGGSLAPIDAHTLKDSASQLISRRK